MGRTIPRSALLVSRQISGAEVAIFLQRRRRREPPKPALGANNFEAVGKPPTLRPFFDLRASNVRSALGVTYVKLYSPRPTMPMPSTGLERRSGPSLRIIVADDDRDTVLTIATLLTQAGHSVREVYRGDAVLAEVRDFRPDAVLLDIGMPGMTGLDVVRELRRDYGRDCPLLVAVTAWNTASDKILGKIVGFDHYVTKPYEPRELMELLDLLSSASLAELDGMGALQEERTGSLRFTISRAGELVTAHLSGRRTAEETRAFLEAVAAAAAALPVRKILISVQGSLPIFKIDEYGASAYLRDLAKRPEVMLALVSADTEIRKSHEYIAAIAVHQGANVRSFADETAALRWLNR